MIRHAGRLKAKGSRRPHRALPATASSTAAVSQIDAKECAVGAPLQPPTDESVHACPVELSVLSRPRNMVAWRARLRRTEWNGSITGRHRQMQRKSEPSRLVQICAGKLRNS